MLTQGNIIVLGAVIQFALSANLINYNDKVNLPHSHLYFQQSFDNSASHSNDIGKPKQSEVKLKQFFNDVSAYGSSKPTTTSVQSFTQSPNAEITKYGYQPQRPKPPFVSSTEQVFGSKLINRKSSSVSPMSYLSQNTLLDQGTILNHTGILTNHDIGQLIHNNPRMNMQNTFLQSGSVMQNAQDMFNAGFGAYDPFQDNSQQDGASSMGKFEKEEKTKFLCVMLGLCATLPSMQTQKPPLTTLYQWKTIDYKYESEAMRNAELASGAFIPNVAAPIDVDVFYGAAHGVEGNKIFLTTPRFSLGIPATLGVVSQEKLNGQNLIDPYPSWKWHRNPEQCNTDRIVSSFRVKIDECGRLWVLDNGSNGGGGQTCPPQILAFDLKTDKLISRFEIPGPLYEKRSVFVTPIVDVRDPPTCKDTFLYIADCQTYSIIIYDAKNNQAWRTTDKTFYPYPSFGTYNIQGEHFDLMDGVLGMDLSPFNPRKPNRDRILFYQALSSPTTNWVYTSYLRNQSRFSADPTSSPEIFNTYMNTRPSQSPALAIDKDGIAYFGLASETTINCWNTYTDYGGSNVDTVYYNPKTMQFASGVKVINNSFKTQELWVVTMRFQKLATGTMKPDETNFRISAGKIGTVLANTNCLQRPSGGGYGFKRHY